MAPRQPKKVKVSSDGGKAKEWAAVSLGFLREIFGPLVPTPELLKRGELLYPHLLPHELARARVIRATEEHQKELKAYQERQRPSPSPSSSGLGARSTSRILHRDDDGGRSNARSPSRERSPVRRRSPSRENARRNNFREREAEGELEGEVRFVRFTLQEVAECMRKLESEELAAEQFGEESK